METDLKPWHLVAVPREDIRKGQPLDAAEFAIHLDQVVDGRAPDVYKKPELFFARTYFTGTFFNLAVELTKRLSGDDPGTSSGVNLTTQFGGGKTHFLTLLYHLFRAGPASMRWQGVPEIAKAAGVTSIPKARIAVLVGNRFDFVSGVGEGKEPKRKTPWGDLAWQLGGSELFSIVRKHDEDGVVPGGEIVQKFLEGGPTLILLDEVLSLSRRARDAGGNYATLASQLYSFLDVLSREVVARPDAVLVVSLPLSEYEMTSEDQEWFQRFEKVLDRLAKPVILAERVEVTEIVRRRLFENCGKDSEVRATSKAYADFVRRHHDSLASDIGAERAEDIFAASYPFHPAVLSVFERKWQTLPTFQQTRGILRLLALWLSDAYQDAYKTNSNDLLLDLGSAPLRNPQFRAAVLDQLGDRDLRAPIETDIAGSGSHAVMLDENAVDTIRVSRLHERVATVVLFESAGGQLRNEATLPEIRFDVGKPSLEIANVETALSDLVHACYYIDAKGTGYWISKIATLNKVLADRRAILVGASAEEAVLETCRSAVRRAFEGDNRLEKRYFPDTPAAIPDAASLRLIVMAPEISWATEHRANTERLIRDILANSAAAGRTFKSGLIFVVGEGAQPLVDEARDLMAIRDLQDPTEIARLRFEDSQVEELGIKQRDSERELSQRVTRSYRHIALLADGGGLTWIDLGVVAPTPTKPLTSFILERLEQDGVLEATISPDFLVRSWPPSQPRWSTRSVRDTFFASPKFPRLMNPDSVKSTIAEGVRRGKFGYIATSPGNEGQAVINDSAFTEVSVELTESAFIVRPTDIRRASMPGEQPKGLVGTEEAGLAEGAYAVSEGPLPTPSVGGTPLPAPVLLKVDWEGEVPFTKWSQFAVKVLSQFSPEDRLVIHVRVDASTMTHSAQQRIAALRSALSELGLSAEVQTDGDDKQG